MFNNYNSYKWFFCSIISFNSIFYFSPRIAILFKNTKRQNVDVLALIQMKKKNATKTMGLNYGILKIVPVNVESNCNAQQDIILIKIHVNVKLSQWEDVTQKVIGSSNHDQIIKVKLYLLYLYKKTHNNCFNIPYCSYTWEYIYLFK